MTVWADSPYGALSELEKYVLLEKGTERAFTGKYTDEAGAGVYACRNCGAPLYRSDDKFRSSCGWPAFDDAIGGAVVRTPDDDGVRTEITCHACAGHLGHVFQGEQATEKDTRYCVNSASLVFEPQRQGRLARAVFAGGCFWGVEELMRTLPGVLTVTSGYTGGRTSFPTYEQVCQGRTGHAEAVEIVYDTTKTDYETLCKFFLEIHDPTQKNRQGPDVGIQYRSAIFYLDDQQKETAKHLLKILRDKGLDVQTQVEPFKRFWQAEDYHQDYYQYKGTAPYCHRYQKRF
ncbi:MAG: bifunctional methionine sulfoxide reductase B/A protein [Planctomycetia bacterium]|nr:bifunctional methionine sulfoxide reductase B/A protein [Planctomycetia bacterium]